MVPFGQILNDRTGFWRYAAMRFVYDKSVQRAAGLSYTTLLAMVPFLAIALTVLSAFPVFDQWQDQIMGVVLNNFLPETGAQVTDYLGNFLKNTGQMTAVGTIVLGLTAVMLLGAIESAMNEVFRVTSPRKLLSRLVVFWTMLTVGPMLLGLSLSLASYIFAMRHLVGGEALGAQIGQLTFLAPFLLSAIAFSLLFIGMPNRSVDIIDGFVGGLVAAALFEALKKGFAFYVTNFPTYQTLYGAVAIVPIFLLWMYVTWIVILLEYLQHRFQDASKPPTYRMLMKELKLGGRDLNWALAALRREKLIDRSESHRWLLSGDLSRITLVQLMTRIGLFLDYDRLLLVNADGGWPGAVRDRLVELEKKRQSVLDIDIAALLDLPKPDDQVPEIVKPDAHQEKPNEIGPKDMAQTID